jgi:hypothetical protein
MAALLVLPAAGGCEEAEVRRIGTSDPSELRTPARVPGNGFVVDGCCSFDLGGAVPERVSSDSLVHVLRLGGREMSITFGAHDSAEPGPGFAFDGSRIVDGVEVRRWRRAGGIRWTAEVPPSPKGQAAGLRPYGLRIVADCTGADCAWTEAIAASVRF